MRVRIEVGGIGGDGSQTLAPPVVVAFQLSASAADAGPVMSLDRSV